MVEFKEKVKEFNSLVGEGKFMAAVDKFYADNIVSVDNEGKPTEGIAAFKEAINKFMDNASNIKTEMLNLILIDNISVTERHYSFDHKMDGHWDYKQISVQRWKDGKIVHERHYYNIG